MTKRKKQQLSLKSQDPLAVTGGAPSRNDKLLPVRIDCRCDLGTVEDENVGMDPRTELQATGEKLKITQNRLYAAVEELKMTIMEYQASNEELNKANEELEIRVVERTQELETQNVKLQQAYQELEQETTGRILAIEKLRKNELMLIQQSRMAAMGEMLGYIAHQWRQPLNVMGLKVQELGVSYEYGDFSKELLDANIAGVMDILFHLSQTINDFRDFSTPDKKKSLFRVDQVVEKTISLIKDNYMELGIAIKVVAGGELQINGYPNEYGQVLLNILMNARDAFVEQSTCQPQITFRAALEDEKAVLTITDNAGGIQEKIIGKIFDPYFTTKELGKGTGIGLFMSKTIIEKNMGGFLTVQNVEDGAEFRIEI